MWERKVLSLGTKRMMTLLPKTGDAREGRFCGVHENSRSNLVNLGARKGTRWDTQIYRSGAMAELGKAARK